MNRHTIIVICALAVASFSCQSAINIATQEPDVRSQLATSSPIFSTEIPSPTSTAFSAPFHTGSFSDAWIAFVKQNDIWLIHPNGTGLHKISDVGPAISPDHNYRYPIYDLKWSSDGMKLAYINAGNNTNILTLYYLQSSFTIRLLPIVDCDCLRTPSDDVGHGLEWSLTNDEIIYTTRLRTNRKPPSDGFWSIDLNKNQRQFLLFPEKFPLFKNNPTVSGLQLSFDGSYAMYNARNTSLQQFAVTDLGTGKTLLLPDMELLGDCEWSPVDLLIACSQTTIDYDTDNFTPEVFILNVDGKILKEFPLSNEMYMPTAHWSPDGKKLAVGYSGAPEDWIAILSVDTGAILPLAPGHLWGWSPDGQWIIASQGKSNLPKILSIVNVTTGEIISLKVEGEMASWQP